MASPTTLASSCLPFIVATVVDLLALTVNCQPGPLLVEAVGLDEWPRDDKTTNIGQISCMFIQQVCA